MIYIYDSMNKPGPRIRALVPVRAAVAAAVRDGLVGNACVIRTIGKALGGRPAAEGEFGAARNTDRPTGITTSD